VNYTIIDSKPYDFTLEDEIIVYDEAQKVNKVVNKLDGMEWDCWRECIGETYGG